MKRSYVDRIINPIAKFVPFDEVAAVKQHRFIFPFWHAVSDEALPHVNQLFSVPTIKAFERDLDYLLSKYNPSAVDDVLRYAKDKRGNTHRLFFPTFDDGLWECYHIIAPILKRKGIPAAFFINPSFVDNKRLFHRYKASLLLRLISEQKLGVNAMQEAMKIVNANEKGDNIYQFLRWCSFSDHHILDELAVIFGIDYNEYLTSRRPYMTLDQLKALQQDGFHIGAHGMDHREFHLSSEDEMKRQIIESIAFVTKELNPSRKLFAFPYTDFGVSDAIFEYSNQRNIWDISFGTAGIKDDHMVNHIQRLAMESGRSIEGKQIVRREYFGYLLKRLTGRNNVSRR